MPARFATSIELHLERLIKLTTTKVGAVTSRAIQTEYKKASAALTARFERINNPSKATLEYTSKKAWLETVKTYEKAFAGIKPILGVKVDAASLEIIGFLAQGLFADTI